MASIHVSAAGAESPAEMKAVAGLDPNFWHPLSRYVDDPRKEISRPVPSKYLIGIALSDRLMGVNIILEPPGRNAPLLIESHFSDRSQVAPHHLAAVRIGRPQEITDHVCFADGLYRLAFTTHALTLEADSVDDRDFQPNEALLQRRMGPDWHDVAALAEDNVSYRHLGIMNTDLLRPLPPVTDPVKLGLLERQRELAVMQFVVKEALEQLTA